MLQQTRVETVMPYYQAFLEAFPDVATLAGAPEDEVMAHWEGLGYYTRARNLLACARELQTTYGGCLPADPTHLRKLPGFGPYTTAAVGSLAFGLPLAALDGNVIRVLCRLMCLDEEPARPSVRKRLQEQADLLLERRSPGEWNEALMELGARVCLPRRPRCGECPLESECVARRLGLQEELPLSRPRGALALRATVVLLVCDAQDRVLAGKRGDQGMLRGLWELPSAEAPWERGEGELEPILDSLEDGLRRALALDEEAQPDGRVRFVHTYSHFQARVRAARLELAHCPPAPDGRHWLDAESLASLGFSTRDRRILKEGQWGPA